LAQRKAADAAAASSARNKALATWTDRIATKIKHNIVRPANASGNPEAIYEITLLPDGSIIGEPRLRQSTGNPALDAAIERAIRKSDPLPKPDDPSVFERILVLRFRPLEE
jgi:colicin import membrane protein